MGIYRGLLYKEWIKIRWVLLIAAAITSWTLVDLFLSLREMFAFMDPMKVWEYAIQRKTLFYSGIEYNALVAGAGIALVQFVPETMKRRLRLLFHLPVAPTKSLYFMMAAGLAAALFVIGLNVAGLAVIVPAFYPEELLKSALVTAAPWLLAGIAAYLSVVLVVVEPSWWRRVLYAAAAFCLVRLYFEGRGYGTYALSLWRYAVPVVLLLFTVMLPAFRFKRGISG